MALSLSLRFNSERFDYSSDLPPDYNAGNRFYGKDVAEYLSEQLANRGFPAHYLDEDWGWLVESTRESSLVFEVAIYNLAEHGEGGRPGVNEWGLWVRSYEQKKLLGLISKNTEIQVPSDLEGAVKSAVQALDAMPVLWQDGPGNDA